MRLPKTWQQRVQALFTLELAHARVLCAALFGAIVLADVVSPPQLNLTFAYVLVILLACWNIGTVTAIVYVLLAFVVQIAIFSRIESTDLTSFYWYVIIGNRLFTFVIVVLLTAPLRSLYRNALASARLDPLTGAVNRREFMEILAGEIARSRRARQPFSVAYLDCDDFKNVNDTRGHGDGDALLRAAVATMRQQLRVIDTVARFGGDEFILLLPSTGGEESSLTLERLRTELNRVTAASGWQATFSTGLGTFDSIDLTAEEVVARCDGLMYRAKGGGKNCIVREVFKAA